MYPLIVVFAVLVGVASIVDARTRLRKTSLVREDDGVALVDVLVIGTGAAAIIGAVVMSFASLSVA